MGPLIIQLPAFVDELVAAHAGDFSTDQGRMALAIALSMRNVVEGGSPFGAAVFAGDKLVAAGVNCVLTSGFTIAHAEVVAMMNAQRTLSEMATPPADLTLVTSAEPCCQCFAALIWSGIDHLVCGAATEDVERIGFDEGPKPQPWVNVLAERSITVREGVMRAEAVATLEAYAKRGGPIYGLRPRAAP